MAAPKVINSSETIPSLGGRELVVRPESTLNGNEKFILLAL